MAYNRLDPAREYHDYSLCWWPSCVVATSGFYVMRLPSVR